MTYPVTGTSPATAAAATTAAPPAGQPSNQMNSDTFLKLLVAQLKYQDPTNPVDSTQFLAQTAQFQMVEQLQQVATATKALAAGQQAAEAAALIGQQVSWTGKDDTVHSGAVSAVQLAASGPILTVGGETVPLSAVTTVTGIPTGTPTPHA